jgi:hypothetical protein
MLVSRVCSEVGVYPQIDPAESDWVVVNATLHLGELTPYPRILSVPQSLTSRNTGPHKNGWDCVR